DEPVALEGAAVVGGGRRTGAVAVAQGSVRGDAVRARGRPAGCARVEEAAGAAAVAPAHAAAGAEILGRALGHRSALHAVGDGVAGAHGVGQVAGVAGLIADLIAADAVDAEAARALVLGGAGLAHGPLHLAGLGGVAVKAVLALGVDGAHRGAAAVHAGVATRAHLGGAGLAGARGGAGAGLGLGRAGAAARLAHRGGRVLAAVALAVAAAIAAAGGRRVDVALVVGVVTGLDGRALALRAGHVAGLAAAVAGEVAAEGVHAQARLALATRHAGSAVGPQGGIGRLEIGREIRRQGRVRRE